MKSLKNMLIVVLLAAMVTACQAQAPVSDMPLVQRESAPGYSGSTGSGMKVASDNAAKSPSSPTVDRVVIKNANISIVVEKPLEAMGNIVSLASEMGGYVVNSQTRKITTDSGLELPEVDITIRVVADKLDAALDRIRKLVKDTGKDIRSENITGQDVTKEYIDLTSRLATYEQTEKQLMRLQETATKVDDVLNILNRLNDIRQQIESIKGQIKYYDESSKLSSIHVQLVAAEGIKPLTIGGWQPLGVALDAIQTLIIIGQFLVNALIVIVIVVLPLFALFFFPGRFIYRKVKKNAKAKAPPQYPPMPPPQPGQ